MAGTLPDLPWWLMLLAPAAGRLAVGRLLRDRPETHGHGVPEVVRAVKSEREELRAGGRGLLKLVASAITIGSGGSAGREGPIVYGGAAFASTVGRTLGFTRRELSILLACGAGAGISASFNAPIAGAVFAMEIILREFELRVFSPIILASVAGTLVSRGVMEQAPMLRPARLPAGQRLGGLRLRGAGARVRAARVRLRAAAARRRSTSSPGGMRGRLSAWLGQGRCPCAPRWAGCARACSCFLSPAVWGTGHDYINLAAAGELAFFFLVTRVRAEAGGHVAHHRLGRLGRHVLPRGGHRRHGGRAPSARWCTTLFPPPPGPAAPTRSWAWAARWRRSPAARSPA